MPVSRKTQQGNRGILRLVPVERRFQLQICKMNNGCWNWTGAHDKDGYGWIRVSGKQIAAHRYSYTASHGQIPGGMQVLHTCDNPCCVNPDHLFIGTQQNNVDDMIEKGRRANICGEKSILAKLTEEQVIDIRTRYTPRHPVNGCNAMAREFGVGQMEISRIVNRKRWKHI
jgi:hypothetical protein